TFPRIKYVPNVSVCVTVERRIAPPPAAPERGVIVSSHTAPQSRDAWHAYCAGDGLHVPAFSPRGSVHAALAGSQSPHRVALHSCGRSRCGPHGGRTTHSDDSVRVAL